MPVLVDGSNLLHSLGLESPRREEVRRRVLDRARGQRVRVTVVFDGPPPPGAPARESLGQVSIVYAAPESADDLIVRSLPHGPSARTWTVVTDDRGLAGRVRARGGQVRSLAAWRQADPDASGSARAAPPRDGLRPDEVAEWEIWFSRGKATDDR